MSQGHITIVGLGSGDIDQISLGIWKRIQQAQYIYLRTADHPVVALLDEHHIQYTSFDSIYEEKASFPEVYEAISAMLLSLAMDQKDIIYAVPGHPMIAEATVRLLQMKCAQHHVTLTIVGGESFLDQAFIRLGFDPIEGFQLLDGQELDYAHLQPALHTIIAQVYDTYSASEVKLTLMELYPDDYPIVVGHALGVHDMEQIHRVPLYDIDRLPGYGNLSLIWVPRTADEVIHQRTFSRLRNVITILRSPDGCPWDREQTHQSLRKYLIEEVYEFLEAIDDDDPQAMCEELGDVLLQIMLHAEIESEQGAFNIDDVVAELNKKLIRRHPHVFTDHHVSGATEAKLKWDEIKAEERKAKGLEDKEVSLLGAIPSGLPSISKALALVNAAGKAGLVRLKLDDALAEVAEKYMKLRQSLEDVDDDSPEIASPMGELIFAIVSLAHVIDIDPEAALALTNHKFMKKFS